MPNVDTMVHRPLGTPGNWCAPPIGKEPLADKTSDWLLARRIF